MERKKVKILLTDWNGILHVTSLGTKNKLGWVAIIQSIIGISLSWAAWQCGDPCHVLLCQRGPRTCFLSTFVPLLMVSWESKSSARLISIIFVHIVFAEQTSKCSRTLEWLCSRKLNTLNHNIILVFDDDIFCSAALLPQLLKLNCKVYISTLASSFKSFLMWTFLSTTMLDKLGGLESFFAVAKSQRTAVW
jgi:hypothetical protein